MAKPPTDDLVTLAAGPHLTPEQRRQLAPPCSTKARGHAAPPGTGPEGETCGSCANIVRNKTAKTYLKCWLNRSKWTSGRKSDVLARDQACRLWAPTERLLPTTPG